MRIKLLQVLGFTFVVMALIACAGAQESSVQTDRSAPANGTSGKIDSRIDQSATNPANSAATASNTTSATDASGAANGSSATPAPAATSAPRPSAPDATSTTTPQFSQREPRYQLTQNDVLDIAFPFTPEYNETVTVQPDGFINLKQLPDMKVEGMTTTELTAALTKAYSKQLHDPSVTITLKTFVVPYFIASGEVKNPGKFQLSGDTSVTQAIGIAGGFTSSAKHSQVYVFRRVSNEWVSAQKIDVKHMLGSANLAEDLHVQPGDMIYVPKSKIAKVISDQPLIPYNLFRLNFGPI